MEIDLIEKIIFELFAQQNSTFAGGKIEKINKFPKDLFLNLTHQMLVQRTSDL